MFIYAPVDCKSISSYEATNGVYQRSFLRRPGYRYVMPRCRGGGGGVCVCVGGGGVVLLGEGGVFV